MLLLRVLFLFLFPLLIPKASGWRRQRYGNKECPFSGVTSYGRVWKKCAGKTFGVWCRCKLQALVYDIHPGGRCRKTVLGVWCRGKLQALVYNILPSTTAVFSYAIGPRKLSANEQFFVGDQTVVSLFLTTQIISDVCFITDHVAYASSNQTKII